MKRLRCLSLGLSLAGALLLTGCASVTVTPIPTMSAKAPAPAKAAPATAGSVAPAPDCGDPTASLRPLSPMPPAGGAMPAGSTMDRIKQRGKLIVGVDQTTLNMGYRDPFTGELSGFDIDVARDVAQAIFGTPDAIQLLAITSSQRVPMLQDGKVDMVVRTMTITCDRLKQVSFSSVYYDAEQRILARRDAGISGAADLAGKPVCATSGSTSLGVIQALPQKPVAIAVSDWTDCLVMLQQNQVDAVSTDDVILSGMAAQDRYTEVVGASLGAQPYGVAMRLGDDTMVRFVNGVLERVRADGRWADSYVKWLDNLLPGPAPAPPAAKYRD